MEYTGQPLEKLLGFLIVVVFLAFYLGIANLLLMFASLSVLGQYTFAYGLSAVVIAPLWFFALYRSRRYVLARTRWRGIRFGLEPGAWGYAWRALLGWLGVILTLGFSHPALRFQLTKYRNDRTFYGNHRLHQGGSKGMLYPVFAHMLIGGVLTAGAVLTAFESNNDRMLYLLYVSVPWLIFGWVVYLVEGKRLMAEQLTSGPLRLTPRPRVGRMLWIYLFGNAVRITGFVVLLLISFLLIGLIVIFTTGSVEVFAGDIDDEVVQEILALLPAYVTAIVGVMSYFLIFLIWNALTHAFITMPVMRHYSQTLEIHGLQELDAVTQRPRDEFGEAEGFAEALNVGASI